MIFNRLLLAAILLPFFSCQPQTEKRETLEISASNMQAVVIRSLQLDSIPSGSGLVKEAGNFYLISDDSPYFFKLGPNYKTLEKNAISNPHKTTAYRIPKAEKPDYESAAIGTWNGRKYLLAFGSGSKSPERDSLLFVPLQNPFQARTYSLKPLYDLIRQQAKLPEAELNLEGSAIIGEELFLLNRGQNVLVQTNWQKTVAFLTQKPAAPQPEIKTYRIALPKIEGIDPGFSGACQLGSENKLLFTASVENTKNWIDDGEILGSFIGILSVDKLANQPLEKVALLTNEKGQPVIEKVESIEFLESARDGEIKTLCLTDDDKGGSKMLEIRLAW